MLKTELSGVAWSLAVPNKESSTHFAPVVLMWLEA
jgi:hypothetical protein